MKNKFLFLLLPVAFGITLGLSACDNGGEESSSESESSSVEPSSTASSSPSSSSAAPAVVVTAKKNGESLTLTDVKDSDPDGKYMIGKYVIDLVFDDKLTFFNGDDEYHFYGWDAETEQNIDQGTLYTATGNGQFTFKIYKENGQVWTTTNYTVDFSMTIGETTTKPINSKDAESDARGKYVVDLSVNDVVSFADAGHALKVYGGNEPADSYTVYTTGTYTVWYNNVGEIWVVGPEEPDISLKVNDGEYTKLTNAKEEGANKGEYKVSLDYGDIIKVKDGDTNLVINNDEESYTIPTKGDYTIVYSEKAEIWVNGPANPNFSAKVNNGNYRGLQNVKSADSAFKGVYRISLDYHDVLSVKDGDTALPISNNDTYTAPLKGEYTLVYDEHANVTINGPADAQITYSLNGAKAVAPANVKTDNTVKGIYNIELNYGDVITFKDGNNAVSFADNSTSYTVDVLGEHVFTYNAEGKIEIGKPAHDTYALTSLNGITLDATVYAHVYKQNGLEKENVVNIIVAVDYDLDQVTFLLNKNIEYTHVVLLELEDEETVLENDWSNVYKETSALSLTGLEEFSWPNAGYYLVGNEEFTKTSESWTIASGSHLDETSEGDLVAYLDDVTLLNGAEFKAKTLSYRGEEEYIDAALAGEYTFASINGEGNIEISATGVYNIKLNNQGQIAIEVSDDPDVWMDNYTVTITNGNPVNKTYVEVGRATDETAKLIFEVTPQEDEITFEVNSEIPYTYFKIYELNKNETEIANDLSNVYRETAPVSLDTEEVAWPTIGYYLYGNTAFVGEGTPWTVESAKEMTTQDVADGHIAELNNVYIVADSEFKFVYHTPRGVVSWDSCAGLAEDSYPFCEVLLDGNVHFSVSNYYNIAITDDFKLAIEIDTDAEVTYNTYTVKAPAADFTGKVFVRAWFGEKEGAVNVDTEISGVNVTFKLNKDVPYTHFLVAELASGDEPDETWSNVARQTYDLSLAAIDSFEWPVVGTYLYGDYVFSGGRYGSGDNWGEEYQLATYIPSTSEEGYISAASNVTLLEGGVFKIIDRNARGIPTTWHNANVAENDYIGYSDTNILVKQTGVYDIKIGSDYKIYVTPTAEPSVGTVAYTVTADLATTNTVYVHTYWNDTDVKANLLIDPADIDGNSVTFRINKDIPFSHFIVVELKQGETELDSEWNNVYRQSNPALAKGTTEFTWPETGYRIRGSFTDWDSGDPVVLTALTEGDYVAKVENLHLEEGSTFKLVVLNPRGSNHNWVNAVLESANDSISVNGENNFLVGATGTYDLFFNSSYELKVVDKTTYNNYALSADDLADDEHTIFAHLYGSTTVDGRNVPVTYDAGNVSFRVNSEFGYTKAIIVELKGGYTEPGSDWDASVEKQSYEIDLTKDDEYCWVYKGIYLAHYVSSTEYEIDNNLAFNALNKISNQSITANEKYIIVTRDREGHETTHTGLALASAYSFCTVEDGVITFADGGIYNLTLNGEGTVLAVSKDVDFDEYTVTVNSSLTSGSKVLVHLWGTDIDDGDVIGIVNGLNITFEIDPTIPYTHFLVAELKYGETVYGTDWVNVLRKTGNVELVADTYAYDAEFISGYYLIGNDAFTESGTAWQASGGREMTAASQPEEGYLAEWNNIVIKPYSTFAVHYVSDKNANYIQWYTGKLDDNYSYCYVNEGNNIYFSRGGVFNAKLDDTLTLHFESVSFSDVTVSKVNNLKSKSTFIRGMDVSSVIALEEAGVKYYDFGGNEEDLFVILASNGITDIRVRIWNDPYDGEGNGYGGGNNDVPKAVLIAQRAKAAGLGLIVDFHYSDFWCDPSKGQSPKAWATYSVDEKADALYAFTVDALNQLLATGVDITMVQVGNETNSLIAGVNKNSDNAGYLKLLASGIKAVRDTCPSAKVALHFTNPNDGHFLSWVSNVSSLDYDVLGTSYYAYEHGTIENLVDKLNTIASTGKEVMVLETSYANTRANYDAGPNNFPGGEGLVERYDITLQGQVDAVRDVYDAVANQVNDGKGIGVCYWEGAWLATDSSDWGTYGTGWASKAAYSYNHLNYASVKDNDGGCARDNQGFFDAYGRVLPSIKVFKEMDDGYTPTSNLVVNGSFEDNDYSEWTFTNNGTTHGSEAEYKTVSGKTGLSADGLTVFDFWGADINFELSQDISVTENGTYKLSYSLNGGDHAGQNIYATISYNSEELYRLTGYTGGWNDGYLNSFVKDGIALEAGKTYKLTVHVECTSSGYWGSVDAIAIYK